MTLEEAMALVEEIADPDFVEKYWRMKVRLMELEAQDKPPPEDES